MLCIGYTKSVPDEGARWNTTPHPKPALRSGFDLSPPGRGKARPGMTLLMSSRHQHHRSFSVESPASASITEMIQKRITICGSVQPFCSKW